MSHGCPGADKSPSQAGACTLRDTALIFNPATSRAGTATWAEGAGGLSLGKGCSAHPEVSVGGGKAQAVHTGVPECVGGGGM